MFGSEGKHCQETASILQGKTTDDDGMGVLRFVVENKSDWVMNILNSTRYFVPQSRIGSRSFAIFLDTVFQLLFHTGLGSGLGVVH